jgi:hypothetical protein
LGLSPELRLIILSCIFSSRRIEYDSALFATLPKIRTQELRSSLAVTATCSFLRQEFSQEASAARLLQVKNVLDQHRQSLGDVKNLNGSTAAKRDDVDAKGSIKKAVAKQRLEDRHQRHEMLTHEIEQVRAMWVAFQGHRGTPEDPAVCYY